jgi:hypothetical protein
MKISAAFPSKYLKAADLNQQDVNVVISKVEIADVGSAEEPESKPVLYFRGMEKGLVLNKTNAGVIAGLYGDDTDMWTDKPITLYEAQVDFQGKATLAIRVRLRAPSGAPVGNGKAAAKNWTLAEATIQAGLAGISRDAMLAKLKEMGFAKWDAPMCTPVVQGMIAAKKDNGGNSFTDDDGAPIDEDSIPF